MTTLIIVSLSLAGILSGSLLGLVILCFLKLKDIQKHLKHIDEKTTDLFPKIQECKATALKSHSSLLVMLDKAKEHRTLMCDGMNMRCDTIDDSLNKLDDRHKRVEEHMTAYSAVLTSQDKLVSAVNELIEEVSLEGKRHK